MQLRPIYNQLQSEKKVFCHSVCDDVWRFSYFEMLHENTGEIKYKDAFQTRNNDTEEGQHINPIRL